MVLAEAGEDNRDGEVIKVAQKLLKKKPTHGWEYENSRKAGLKGMKFHVFDNETKKIVVDDVFGGMFDAEDESGNSEVIVWSFLVIADKSVEDEQVKSFLEKLVYITMPMRENEIWREGDLLCAQPTFAPILLQKMQQVDEQGRLAMVNEKVSTTREIMRENIELALEKDQALSDLKNQSEELNAMAKQFKKRSNDIKKFKMWQNAKHGLVVGTAVTAATAVIVVPPLVALL